MMPTAWSPGSICSGLWLRLLAFWSFDGESSPDFWIWLSLAAKAVSTVWASAVASWFLSGRARCAQLARASGSLSCSSSTISWCRRFADASGCRLGDLAFSVRARPRRLVGSKFDCRLV
jgi:hypothetical protein